MREGKLKPIAFLGDSLARLRDLPEGARHKAGYQLYRVQGGLEPDDWKPLREIGKGVREIRVRHGSGAFRVIYLATLPDAVYVLHVFQKKTRTTSRRDLELAARRMRELVRRR